MAPGENTRFVIDFCAPALGTSFPPSKTPCGLPRGRKTTRPNRIWNITSIIPACLEFLFHTASSLARFSPALLFSGFEVRLSMRFSGQSALVIGGTSGIGWGVAEAFAAEGAEVLVTGLTEAEVGTARRKSAVVRSAAAALDVTNAAAVARLARELTRVDALVNCAGIIRRREEYELAVFERLLAVNLTGTMRVCEAVRGLTREAWRRHRQHRLDVQLLRRRTRPRLRRFERRRHPAHQVARTGIREPKYSRERDRSRLDPHGDHRAALQRSRTKPADRRAHPARPLGRTHGHRRARTVSSARAPQRSSRAPYCRSTAATCSPGERHAPILRKPQHDVQRSSLFSSDSGRRRDTASRRSSSCFPMPMKRSGSPSSPEKAGFASCSSTCRRATGRRGIAVSPATRAASANFRTESVSRSSTRSAWALGKSTAWRDSSRAA